ncbi:MAG: hypothetical protein H0U76_25425, partial [Ktedonobacteraceae bacterium]|nr:hypothetical protein [Ktedonobacteraceae bacterium]
SGAPLMLLVGVPLAAPLSAINSHGVCPPDVAVEVPPLERQRDTWATAEPDTGGPVGSHTRGEQWTKDAPTCGTWTMRACKRSFRAIERPLADHPPKGKK